MPRKIRYVSAPCGSGKTHQIVEQAIRLARRGWAVMILQPTTELVDKTVKEEFLTRAEESRPEYRVIHGGTVEKVGYQIMEAMKADHFGMIIFTTHQGFLNCPHFYKPEDWCVLVDETLDPVQLWARRLPHNHDILTGHIDLEAGGPVFSRVTVVGQEGLEAKAKNKEQDAVFELFKDSAWMLLNAHWDVSVHTQRYSKVVNDAGEDLELFGVLQPTIFDGFHSVLIASAEFTDSALFRIWTEQGVVFVEDEEFASGLRFQTHPNGDQLTIYYAFERDWSKYWRDIKVVQEGDKVLTPLDLTVRAAANAFQNDDFVWQANKDVPKVFAGRGTRLPNAPHGLNQFQKCNNVVFLSALNGKPIETAFYKTLGLTVEDIRRFRYYSVAYQAVMRCSLRDPDNKDPKTVIVPDKGAAEYLASLFPGAKVLRLDVGLPEGGARKKSGRPKIHADDAIRTAAYRRRKKAELLSGICAVGAHDTPEGELRDEMSIEDIYKGFVTPLQPGNVFRTRRSPTPLGRVSWADPDQFVQFLRDMHQRVVTSKDDNQLVSPSTFDPAKVAGKKRSEGNIVRVDNVYLDFENGDLSPDEFAALFPNVRMVGTNSYRHTGDQPRFRVIIPTSQPIGSPDAYKLIIDSIAYKLEEAGYRVRKSKRDRRTGKNSGLDWSKRTPASLFYLPCQAEDPTQSFFHDYAGPGRELLDPAVWIENCPPSVLDGLVAAPPLVPDIQNEKEVDLARVERATAIWRQSFNYPCEGGSRFFTYALELRSAGMSMVQIEFTLRQEAQHGRHPAERRDQVKTIMDSLKRTWKTPA